MGKITEIKLVGQPIFKQIMNLVDKVDINGLIRKHESDYYYKSFKTRTHLFTMLFGILSRCDSMTEVCEGLRAMGGKLNHLGMDQAPAKSTACDGLRNRNHKVFEDLCFNLVKHRFATPFDIDENNFKKLSVFQYLIGNTDWFISSRKNIVLLQSKDSSSLYAVPFDFDFAGFVDAGYSKPEGVPESLLSDRRVYKGVCCSYDELKEIFEFYRELKPQFESIINDQELLSKTGKKQILQYLSDSYKVLENNELAANKFLNTCETRKDYNLF